MIRGEEKLGPPEEQLHRSRWWSPKMLGKLDGAFWEMVVLLLSQDVEERGQVRALFGRASTEHLARNRSDRWPWQRKP